MKTILIFLRKLLCGLLLFPFSSLFAQNVKHTTLHLRPDRSRTYFHQQLAYVHFLNETGLSEQADSLEFTKGVLRANDRSFEIKGQQIVFMNFEIYDIAKPYGKTPHCFVYAVPEFENEEEMKFICVGEVKRGRFTLKNGNINLKYYFVAEGYPPLEVSFRH